MVMGPLQKVSEERGSGWHLDVSDASYIKSKFEFSGCGNRAGHVPQIVNRPKVESLANLVL